MFTRLKIHAPDIPLMLHFKNQYKITLAFMHGDADEYDKVSHYQSSYKLTLRDVNFWNQFTCQYSETSFENFREYLCKQTEMKDTDKSSFEDMWPSGKEYCGGIRPQLEDVVVTYINENGIECRVGLFSS